MFVRISLSLARARSLSPSLPPLPRARFLPLSPSLPLYLPARVRIFFQMKVQDNSAKRRKVNMIAEELRALEKTVSEKVTRLLLKVVWELPACSKVLTYT